MEAMKDAGGGGRKEQEDRGKKSPAFSSQSGNVSLFSTLGGKMVVTHILPTGPPKACKTGESLEKGMMT